MPLELPNLDDRTYKDLVEEALSAIPTYAPEWTNYNPSDPGIALIELFAYLTEMLIYQLDRVTDENLRVFLKLLNGPDWQPTQDLREEIRQTVLTLRSHYRAVTRDDYERLSTDNFNAWLVETQQSETVGLIQRTRCVMERNLEMNLEDDRKKHAPGHVSMVILPRDRTIAKNELGSQPTEVQCQKLWDYLDVRRILTTRLHIVGPTYAPVSAEILVAARPDVPENDLRRQIVTEIENFLSPLPVKNSSDYQGWTFGRDVYVSEFYELLENIAGVDYVPDILLTSACQDQDNNCVGAETLWNDDGEAIALRLYDHHLPAARINPDRIVIAPSQNLLSVQLQLSITPNSTANFDDLKRDVKQEVRTFFHPLYRGPKPQSTTDTLLKRQDLIQAVRDNVRNIQSVEIVLFQALSSRLSSEGLVVKAREVIDLKLEVVIAQGAS